MLFLYAASFPRIFLVEKRIRINAEHIVRLSEHETPDETRLTEGEHAIVEHPVGRASRRDVMHTDGIVTIEFIDEFARTARKQTDLQGVCTGAHSHAVGIFCRFACGLHLQGEGHEEGKYEDDLLYNSFHCAAKLTIKLEIPSVCNQH